MKILVCLTHVPDTTSRISFVDNYTKFEKTGVQYIIGPYDDYALAKALDIKESKEGTVTVLNVGLSETESSLRKALAIGADDAIRVNLDPTDAYQVAELIANIVKEKKFDLILMGRESIDYNGGQVHGIVGEMLDIPSFSPIMKLELDGRNAKIEREIEGGTETIELQLPFVAGCQEPIAEWRIPNMRGIMTAKSKPLEVVEPPANTSKRTEILKYEMPPQKGSVKLVDAQEIEKLVELLNKEAKVI